MKFAIIDDLVSDSIACYKDLMSACHDYFDDVQIDSYSSFEEYKNSKEKYYAIFLDVDLGTDMNGLQVFQYIDKSTKVIYISNYDYYVFDAVHLVPYDYLRKDSFSAEIDLLLKRLKSDYYFENHIVNLPKIGKVSIHNILYFEAHGNSERCVTQFDDIEIRIPQKVLIELLDFNGYSPFVKVNRSVIVNCKNIVHVEENVVQMNNGDVIQFSEVNKRAIFSEIINKRI